MSLVGMLCVDIICYVTYLEVTSKEFFVYVTVTSNVTVTSKIVSELQLLDNLVM